jgi:VanZ like protein
LRARIACPTLPSTILGVRGEYDHMDQPRLLLPRRVVAALGCMSLLGLAVLLVAPLGIVHYHTRFWELTGRHLGLGWTVGREQALDAALNIALFVPPGFLTHRWWRAGSPPAWASACATVALLSLVAAGFETLQVFLPRRSASLSDVLSDTIGAAVGVGLDALLARIALRSNQRGT